MDNKIRFQFQTDYLVNSFAAQFLDTFLKNPSRVETFRQQFYNATLQPRGRVIRAWKTNTAKLNKNSSTIR